MQSMAAEPTDRAGVLITRPAPQAEGIKAGVEARGLQALLFPTLEIELNSADSISSSLREINAGDILIFVSPNAVYGVFNTIDTDLRGRIASAQIAAVGRRTQAALEDENLFVAITPDRRHQNSEGLLQHALLQHLDGRRVYIVRGQSGRETLKRTLTERGAHPVYIQAYTRTLPSNYNPEPVIQGIVSGTIGYVMLTSFEAFENLCEMLGEGAETLLEKTEFIVAGARIARKVGASHPRLVLHEADSAADDSMLAALEQAQRHGSA